MYVHKRCHIIEMCLLFKDSPNVEPLIIFQLTNN